MPEFNNVTFTRRNQSGSTNNTQVSIDWTNDCESEEDNSYSAECETFETRRVAEEFKRYLRTQSGVHNPSIRSRLALRSNNYEVRWEESPGAETQSADEYLSEDLEDSREEEGSTEIDSELGDCDLSKGLYASELFDSDWHGNKYVYLAPVNDSGTSRAKVSDKLYSILKENYQREVYVENNEVKGFKKGVK